MERIRFLLRCLSGTLLLVCMVTFVPVMGIVPDPPFGSGSQMARAQAPEPTATPIHEISVEFAHVVGQTSINVRDASNATALVIGVLNPGEPVQVLGRNAAGNWLNIELPDGGEGWVYAPLVQTETAVHALDNTILLGGVTHNAQWLTVIQDFDGVAMVLVPAGCFSMGSSEGDANEQPVHQVCIDEPFWIDRYEVSNEQFDQGEGQAEQRSNLTSPTLPREQINWFEARDFCAVRDARLPTEAEWEYAARGPDALIYPWGNAFDGDRVVYGANSGGDTAPITSRPGGVSWVGAYNMSGNVWEWTHSRYAPYPYVISDARELDTSNPTDQRVLRGGSIHFGAHGLRVTVRFGDFTDGRSTTHGFRCARSYP